MLSNNNKSLTTTKFSWFLLIILVFGCIIAYCMKNMHLHANISKTVKPVDYFYVEDSRVFTYGICDFAVPLISGHPI